MATEHVHEEPFRYFAFMATEYIVKCAAYKAIKKCSSRVSESRTTFHADWGVDGMFAEMYKASDDVSKTLNDAVKSLHTTSSMDLWLNGQPEWLQRAVANEVNGWVTKTMAE